MPIDRLALERVSGSFPGGGAGEGVFVFLVLKAKETQTRRQAEETSPSPREPGRVHTCSGSL